MGEKEKHSSGIHKQTSGISYTHFEVNTLSFPASVRNKLWATPERVSLRLASRCVSPSPPAGCLKTDLLINSQFNHGMFSSFIFTFMKLISQSLPLSDENNFNCSPKCHRNIRCISSSLNSTWALCKLALCEQGSNYDQTVLSLPPSLSLSRSFFNGAVELCGVVRDDQKQRGLLNCNLMEYQGVRSIRCWQRRAREKINRN